MSDAEPVRFHPHAAERLRERGATADEVILTVRTGSRSAARLGRIRFSLEHSDSGEWQGRPYYSKVIDAYAVPEDGWLVITVIVKFNRRQPA